MTVAFPADAEPLRTLPISPYPAQPGTRVRAHFVTQTRPQGEGADGWVPWISGWSKWVSGRILGYKDFAGREARVSASCHPPFSQLN